MTLCARIWGEACDGKHVDVKLDGKVFSISLKYVSNEAFSDDELTLKFYPNELHAAKQVLARRTQAESEAARNEFEQAVPRARAAHAALVAACSPLATPMLAFVDEAAAKLRLRRLARGRPPRLPDRARFVNKLGARSPWKQSNTEAFEAIDKLIEIGWPPINTKQRMRKLRAHRWFESRESELAQSAL